MAPEENLLRKDVEWHPYKGQYLSLTGFVHLFKIDVDFHFKDIDPAVLLSGDELRKAGRFLNQGDKECYIVRKYFLRLLLARFLNQAPAAIKYSLTGNKKPSLPDIQFNLSHSKNQVIIAVSSTAIGIDIEYIDGGFNYREVQEFCFSKEESEFVVNGKDPLLNFYSLWTRKEALLKATGEGLIENLDQVPSLKTCISRAEETFRIESFKTSNGYLLSTASPAGEKIIKFWEYGN